MSEEDGDDNAVSSSIVLLSPIRLYETSVSPKTRMHNSIISYVVPSVLIRFTLFIAVFHLDPPPSFVSFVSSVFIDGLEECALATTNLPTAISSCMICVNSANTQARDLAQLVLFSSMSFNLFKPTSSANCTNEITRSIKS